MAKRIVVQGDRIIVEEQVYKLEIGLIDILFGSMFKWVFCAGPFKKLEDAKKVLRAKLPLKKYLH